jgi:hypothetical protein
MTTAIRLYAPQGSHGGLNTARKLSKEHGKPGRDWSTVV